jgi:hypothetical protein
MSFFLKELRIVPKIVWPIALLVAGISVWFFLLRPRSPGMPQLGRFETALFIWGSLFIFAWVVLIGYIFADARRRGMRQILWTLLAIFVPNFIGAILYFFLRDPLLISCPSCGGRCRSTFVFCPLCGSELAPSCPACKRSVEPGWHLCAYCGTPLNAEVRPAQHP